MGKEDVVFCVDSDGCAMDTMTFKHQLFFGPLAADEFGIEDRETFLKEWNRVNLYSTERGINRFVGLVRGLEGASVPGIDSLKDWVVQTASLSNAALEEAIAQHPSEDLKKALSWSKAVNRSIQSYEGPSLAFKGVREGLARFHELGKVCVVSSANQEAVLEEWRDQGLMEYVDELYCQDKGKKEDIIASLVAEGYQVEKIMMIGDSPGDLDAAEKNNVSFYPILVGKEEESWQGLRENFAEPFARGEVSAEEFSRLQDYFWTNLGA